MYNQQITHPILFERHLSLAVKREDLIDPLISGNKYRKLKYNLKRAKILGYQTLLTYGGAFSNHIAAVAKVGHDNGLHTIGVIRGEELEQTWANNPTLHQAHAHGMQFYFVDRETYRQKHHPSFLQRLKKQYGVFYDIPEGGTNALAVKGCEEILTSEDADFDVIATCVGTGGTLAGLINSAASHQRVEGFSVLKGDFQKETLRNFVTSSREWELVTDYHFGGYAKVSEILIQFINQFKRQTGIALDPAYTGKLLYGIFDRVQKGCYAPNTKILAIHTGGLQGIKGMNTVLKRERLSLLDE